MKKGRDIRILGLAETENESSVETLIKFLKDYLNVCCLVGDIDTAFRINRVTGTSTGSPQPRVLLGTFTSMLKKLVVMSAGKPNLKGTKIFGPVSPAFDKVSNSLFVR
nr:unnamed protein product [Callosobruchus analis]